MLTHGRTLPRQHTEPTGTLEAHRQINTHAHTLWAVPGTRHDPPTHSQAGEHRFSEADILAVSIRLPSSLFSSWML